jgi:hypothetical protein
LTPLLGEGQFLLVGISFVVVKPEGFRDAFYRRRPEALPLAQTVFQLLDELDLLALKDLRRFMQSYRIPRADRLTDEVLKRMLDETEGRYELTVEALRLLMDRAWIAPEPRPDATAEEEDNY